MEPLPRRSERGRRVPRNVALVVAAATLGFWPFAARYTSFGIDTEHEDGDRIRCDWWRVRWPGDGRVGLLHEVTWRPHDARPVERFDLGGAFLRDEAPPGAGAALALAVPHWLLVIATTAIAGVSLLTTSATSAPRR